MFWGYVENSEDPANKTAYFKDFEESLSKEELYQHYNQYRRVNQETLSKLGQEDGKVATFKYQDKNLITMSNPLTDPICTDKLYIKV